MEIGFFIYKHTYIRTGVHRFNFVIEKKNVHMLTLGMEIDFPFVWQVVIYKEPQCN